MPSWFMLIPSETEIVVNSRGVPPASAIPSFAASTWKPCVMLHGVCSPFIDTTPIIGRAIAASSSPIARIKARCGVRYSPSRVMSERSFFTDDPRHQGIAPAPELCRLHRGDQLGRDKQAPQMLARRGRRIFRRLAGLKAGLEANDRRVVIG